MSQSKLIRLILKIYVETSKCLPLISKDGITTDQFAIAQYDSLFVGTCLNIRQLRSQIPTIARTVSIAKNLDYYQNKICHEIPSIPDTAQIKPILQKLRITIITLFLKLNKLMVENKINISLEFDKYLVEWNKHSEQVLMTTSTILIGYQQGKTDKKTLESIKGTLDYLDISESLLDDEISYLY